MQRLNMAKETYVETIYELVKLKGAATVTDIAKTLEVKPSSVTEMLHKLDDMDYVEFVPYRNVALTVKGVELAVFLKKAKLSLKVFFELLNMPEHVAEVDACKVEHMLHMSTLKNLSVFVETVQNTQQGKSLLQVFHQIVKG
ncbi:MAG: metal-dependent transcriptional regulator [Candidatus Bathyarchaeia archaeon]